MRRKQGSQKWLEHCKPGYIGHRIKALSDVSSKGISGGAFLFWKSCNKSIDNKDVT